MVLNLSISRESLLVSTLIIAGLAALAIGYWRQEGSGSLAAVNPFHDFGDVAHGETETHQFTIVNNSDSPLFITGIDSSCTCAVVGNPEAIVDAEIPPGESAPFVAAFKPIGLAGPVSGTFLLEFSKSDKRVLGTLELRVAGEIKGDFVVEPRVLNFGKIGIGKASPLAVSVVSESTHHISAVRASSDRIKFETVEESPGRQVLSVSVETSDLVFHKEHHEYLVVETSSPTSPRLLLPIVYEFEPELETDPKHLFFDRDASSLSVRLKAKCSVEIVSARIVSNDGSLLGHVSCDNGLANLHTIELKVPIGQREQHSESNLELRVRSESQSWNLSVPVYF